MKCCLCKEEKVLIKKSHLIPNFFFKSLYNKHNRLIRFDAVKMFKGVSESPAKPPTSPYEKYILCAKCDNEIINKYESYFAKNIFHGTNFVKKTYTQPNKINHYLYNDLNYDLANIFFLTLLWRANLSKRQGFKEVNLAPNIAESLSSQILTGNYDIDSIKVTALKLSENSNFKRSVSQFRKISNYYTIILRDLIIFYHLEKDEMYNRIKRHGIDENGNWILPEIPKSMEENFLLSYINPQ